MEDLGEAQLTFFAEDSPAKTSVQRVKEQELPENVRDFGKSMRESLEKFGLNLSLPKTHHCFELGALELSSKTWPKWGMMQGGACWELGTLVRPTNATGCGSWPTPTVAEATKIPATANYGQVGLNNHPRIRGYPTRERMKKDRKGLDGGTKTQQKWMTHQARDWKGPSGRAYKGEAKDLPSQTQHTGQLNPSWVEWLMNWPINWSSKEVLRNEHFEYWSKASAANVSGSGGVRDLQLNQRTAPTPQERKHDGQQSNKHTGTLCQMSRKPACKAEVGTSQQEEGLSTLRERIPIQASKAEVLQSQLRESLGLGEAETIPRTAHGVKNRVDRLKAIGNGQVPQCAATAFRILSEGLI